MKELEEIPLETVHNFIWLEWKYTTNKILEKANSVEYLSDNNLEKKKSVQSKTNDLSNAALKWCNKPNKILLDISTSEMNKSE